MDLTLQCACYMSTGMGGRVGVQDNTDMQDNTDVRVALWMSCCTWVMVQTRGLWWCRHGQAVSTAAARGEARSSSKWGSSNNGEQQH